MKTGSSYLSQSELTLTFGLGKRDAAERVVIEWPSGAVQEFKNVRAGSYQCTEGQGWWRGENLEEDWGEGSFHWGGAAVHGIGGLGHLAVKLRLCVLRHRYRRGCLHPLWLTGAAINMGGSADDFGIRRNPGRQRIEKCFRIKEAEMSGRSAAW